jgi:hypothetical protein
VRTLRRLVRGWADNVVVELNKHKQEVPAKYNMLDAESKDRNLDDGECRKRRIETLNSPDGTMHDTPAILKIAAG